MATELYELRVNGVSNQERNECVMHFVGGNLTANDPIESGRSLLDSWVANIESLWQGVLPVSYYIDTYQARRVIPVGSCTVTTQYQYQARQGTLDNYAAADQVCPCVSLIPQMGFKSGGKIFLPSVGDGQIIDNAYQASYLTAINSLMVPMLSNFGVSGKTWQLAILSRKLGTYTLALGYNLSPRIGFQKRRRSPV